jgi:hypothetical protein
MLSQQPKSLRKFVAHKSLLAKVYKIPGQTLRTQLAAWDEEEIYREALMIEGIVLNELIEQLILDSS